MKYLILSDIHGSLPRLEQVLAFYEAQRYDMLLLLGDLLNYGPRNGVPDGLDAPGVATRLNRLADRIVAVRGNCDSEVDQMLLRFPCMADSAMVVERGQRLLLTHGHLFDPVTAWPGACEVVFCGHTHLWQLSREAGRTVCNTGSITFPKGGRPATFATIDDDGQIRVRTLAGGVLAAMPLCPTEG